ncbi:SDR family NAD(P)-dependent oxidoreductase, partial [Ideonella azotifigens]
SSVLNPNIDFEATPFVVQQELADWPAPVREVAGIQRVGKRIAGISSFGAGGANAHVVIEEYSAPQTQDTQSGPALIVLSARSEDRLQEQVRQLRDAIETDAAIHLADLAYTLQVGREAMEERLGLVVSSTDELRQKLGAYLEGNDVDELYRGQVKRNKDALAGLSGDEDLGTAVEAWIAKGKHGKLLDVWVRGMAVQWSRLYGDKRPQRISLPTYPFARERYWVQTSPTQLVATVASLHPLVHRNTSDVDGLRFSTQLSGEEFFLADHVVRGERVLPGVAQLEMARTAASHVLGHEVVALSDVVWMRPVVLASEGLSLHIALDSQDDGSLSFEIYSEDGEGEARVYSQGHAHLQQPASAQAHDLQALRAQCQQSQLDAAQCYARFEQLGLHYGPAFQGLREVHVGQDQLLARISLPDAAPQGGYQLHPSLLDAALQATLGLQLDSETLMLPFALGTLEAMAPCTGEMWAVVRRSAGSSAGDAVQRLDVDLCDAQGNVCVRFGGFSLRSATATVARVEPLPMPRAVAPQASVQTLLFQPRWTAQAATPATGDAFARHLVLLCGVEATDLAERLPGIVCLTPANDGALAQRFESAAIGLLGQLQALTGQPGRHLIQVLVPATGEGQALVGLGGMLRTAQVENPRITGQVIGVQPGQDLAQALLDNCGSNARQVRYTSSGEREVAAWTELAVAADVASPWKPHGVYLITGGAGGLGLIFAREIARHARNAVLILTGRSALNEGIQASIRELETLGAVVRYHAVDVSDGAALTQLLHSIPEEFEGLDGIVHSAGVLRDSLIARKTPQQLREVLAAKVAGTIHLDEASRDMALDFFICFSSIAGALGNAGQADYAAANAFMDAFAQHRNALVAQGKRRGQTLSLNWPLWDEGGMQVDAATRKLLGQQFGLHPLVTANGVLALRQALASGGAQCLVVAGEAVRIRQLLLGQPSQAPLPPVPQPAQADRQASDHDLPESVKRALVAMVSALIKVRPEDIDGETALSEYGFDSVSLAEFGAALNQQYTLDLKPTIFFEHPTLSGLAAHLAREHHAALAPRFAGAASMLPTAPPAVAPPAHQRTGSRGRNLFNQRQATASRRPVVDEPIAIIGMSGHFPQARDIAEFWRNLQAGKDCIGEVPRERWDWQAWFGDPITEDNKTNVKWGGFIEGVDEFDPMFFGISPKEAELMDPQQRLMMAQVWKALEDAGYAGTALAGSDTAIYVGTGATGYGTLLNRARLAGEAYAATGGVPSVGPNRLSYLFDWHGASEPVETACSSSLVALRRGVAALQKGEASVAVVGGVNTLVAPEAHVSFNKAGMLSEDGRCKTFASNANGYVRGEGVAMLVLKRLSDAERDGDHIHGLVRGSAENHGGRANSLTAPNPVAQAAVIAKAHRNAGIDPRTVTYIEAHGTGTPLGDPVEINGLKAAFKELYAAIGDSAVAAPHCGLGSVKTNIGHLELAAGVAGVVKVLLQMKHKTLVKSLHSETLNPYIDLDGSPFYVVQQTREWEALRDAQGRPLPRRAGVSSFGFGGVNAHVVLEEYIAPASAAVDAGPVAVVLSARTESQLAEQVQQLLAAIEAEPGIVLADLAYTLQVGRKAMEERLALVVGSLAELRERLADHLAGKLAMAEVYRGQVKAHKDTLAALAGDEDMAAIAEAWMAKGKLGKLLDLWVKGMAVDWQRLYGAVRPRRISLPTYPFARERHWVRTDDAKPAGAAATAALHPLLHRNTSDLDGLRFSTQLSGEAFFLADHVVREARVLPAAAQLEMARQAASKVLGEAGRIALHDVAWQRPIAVGEGGLPVHVTLYPEANGELGFEIRGEGAGDEAVVYSQGMARSELAKLPVEAHDLAALRQRCDAAHLSGAQCQERFARMGLRYGPAFRGLHELFVGAGQVLARLVLPEAVQATWPDYQLHPSLVDAALQATLGLQVGEPQLMLPFALGSLETFAPCTLAMWAIAQRCPGSQAGESVQRFDIDLCDEQGAVCVRLRQFGVRSPMGSAPQDDRPVPAAVPAPAGSVLQDKVRRMLVEMVSQLIKVKPEDIDGDTALSEYGFDSISLTEFGNALSQQYRIDVKPTIFFEHPTLDALAGHLASEHHAALAPLLAPAVAEMTDAMAPMLAQEPAVERPRSRGRASLVRPAAVVSQRQALDEPIAIIGMSGQFPQAPDLEAFWRVLAQGQDCITEIPPERWDWREWFGDPAHEQNRTHIKWGGFMAGIDQFDPMFFGISPKEARLMDPQQRLMMMHVWKALEDAGYAGPALAGSDTAIYVGTGAAGYGTLLNRVSLGGEAYSSTGGVPSVGPNRMSYFLDWHGPSEPVETACSSSLVALRRAILAIQRGDCGLAIAGGVNTMVTPEMHISFNKAGMLSEDGRCKTFASNANGYVRGEGVAMLVLKRLSDAERDGDHIHGLVRGSAENHGGRANSLTAPNPVAQAAVIAKAHRNAGIDPRTVSYIEAHGTGTPLGDPVEINGLKAAFKELYAATGDSEVAAPHCGLGSVKTNIGHLELAAGVAGVVKVLLQMKHKTLVKSLHSETLNPYIDLDGSPFYVVQQTREWEALRDAKGQPLPRRAGVSSFGFGGVNAHVVLEEYIAPASAAVDAGPVAVVLSARNEERLLAQARQLSAFIALPENAGLDLNDLAYTLQVGREAMEERLALVAGSLDELRDKLARFLAGEPGVEAGHRGQVRPHKAAMAALPADEDHAQAVRGWLANAELNPLLALWVKGFALDWAALHGPHQRRRISLPTYAFAQERHWVPGGAVRPGDAANEAVPPAARETQLKRNTSEMIDSIAANPAQAADERLREKSILQIRQLISEGVGLPVETIQAHIGFDEYGIDSILALELTNALRDAIGAEGIGTSLFFEHPTIERLVDHFMQTEAEALRRWTGLDRVAVPRPVAPAVVSPGVSEPEARPGFDVAIVGLAGRYPQAADVGELWAHLAGTPRPAPAFAPEPALWNEARGFDPRFFGLSPQQAQAMGPQARLFLQQVHASVEEAGYTPARLAHSWKIGLFVGVSHERGWAIADQVSQCFDFQGPGMAVDTAGASALTAVHLAVDSLRSGDSEVAIAGGVDGEAVGALVLKPLHRALADGDHVHGVIKGSAVSSPGRTRGDAASRAAQQARLVGDALQRAGVDARAVSHVTTQAASGLVGLSKLLLQMKHQTLLPDAGSQLTHWRRPVLALDGQPRELPRMAGVSSFGPAGANAHVVIAEHIPPLEADEAANAGQGPALVLLSARDEAALQRQAQRLLAAIATPQPTAGLTLANLAYTLQVGREAMAERLALQVDSLDDLRAKLAAFIAGNLQLGGLHRGQAGRQALAALLDDEDMDATVRAWIAKGKFGKLADLWAQGFDLDWQRLHPAADGAARPKQISLPTYPFAAEFAGDSLAAGMEPAMPPQEPAEPEPPTPAAAERAAPAAVKPMPRQAGRTSWPLSFAQQRLWFLDQYEPGLAIYNIPAAVRLTGQLDTDALARTLNEIVRRHEALRTSFAMEAGEPVQVIAPALVLPLQTLDLSGLPTAQREAQTREQLQAEADQPFDLATGPLIRFRLLRLASDAHLLLVTMHHIVSDGWSMGIVVQEVAALYRSFLQGLPPALPALPIQYADFAEWQRQRLSGGLLARQLGYWQRKLEGSPQLLALPTDRPRPTKLGHRGAALPFTVPAAAVAGLRALGHQAQGTLFMALCAAFNVLMARHSGQTDICIGTPIANRNRTEIENLIGFFVNTLVLRTQVDLAQDFLSLLRQVRQTTLEAYDHQDVPFEQLVEAVRPERHTSYSPLFQVMLVLQNAPMTGLVLPGLRAELMQAERVTAKFDLTLTLTEDPQGLHGELEYNTDLFEAATIERMAGHFTQLLRAIVEDPERPVGELPMLGAAERQQLLHGFNDTATVYPRVAPGSNTLHQLFEAQVQRSPERTAVVYEGASLSYAELNAQANRLARQLRSLGVGPDSLVGLCMERSVEMIVGLYATLKAGGAYVPLDPGFPAERLATILDDAKPVAVLTQSHLQDRVPATPGLPVIVLDDGAELLVDPGNLENLTEPGLLAYVIYTSGSTGKPKGVGIEHRGIVNRLQWMQQAYPLTAADRVLQKTPFSFDVSVWEFFWPLLEGATLVVARPGGHQDVAYLARVIDEQRITTLHFVPPMLDVFLNEARPGSARSLRQVMCSGQALPLELQQRFFQTWDHVELHNLYGPTEASVDVTYWQCHKDSELQCVPIGKPIANIQIHILDD